MEAQAKSLSCFDLGPWLSFISKMLIGPLFIIANNAGVTIIPLVNMAGALECTENVLGYTLDINFSPQSLKFLLL